ncbi:MAG: hypothetical protein RSA59_05665 [Raoultibacter sp.]
MKRLMVGAFLFAALIGSGFATRAAVPPTLGSDSPALAALLVALGGSRGILSEILWWRIGELQKENRYRELIPLTTLLVTLEPSTPDVWTYNAWNLAYNVSVMHHDAPERWSWIKRGLALLERGLRITPQASPLLQQMGWIYEDKIGGRLDPCAPYYRAHLSELRVPADADAFARRLGATLDWTVPHTHALYWYERSGDAYPVLRTLIALLVATDNDSLVPAFIATARAQLRTLPPQQREQVHAFAQDFAQQHSSPELITFLKEIHHDTNRR